VAYNPNIPQPSDLLSQSQQDILNNFQAIQTLVDVNHVDFASSDQGKHKWITFPSQAAIPPAGSSFAGTELGLYNAVYTTTNKQEIFVNKTNQITVVQVPLTASLLSTNSAPASNNGMWTYLPSGLILKSGSIQGSLSGLTTITPTGGPAFTQILTVLVSPFNSTTAADLNFSVRLVSINSATTFQVYFSSRTSTGAASGQTGLQFLAIGY
jgi:hypothetical protein